MGRLTDDDRKFGPLTWGRSSWKAWRLVFSSGGNDEFDRARNALTVYAFGWIVELRLPNILQPFRIRHEANWDAATVARIGRNYYFETFPREYGISLSGSFLNLFLGAQTHDSDTTQSWGYFLPWAEWRFVRFSLYNPDHTHFWTQLESERDKGFSAFDAQRQAEELCPKVTFQFDDFDGERITATCHINEREWRFGKGWFKWLSIFRRPQIQRCLSLSFNKEVGPEKGSWKGGTLGHAIEMLPKETPEAAFARYCEKEHRSKYRTFKIKLAA